MNTVIKMFLNLILVGAISGVILAGVFHAADPLIQANKEKELKEAIFVVLPEAKDYRVIERRLDKDTVVTVYKGIDESGNPVGIAFKADGFGFQGNVGIMVGLDLDYLKLKGIKVLEQVETPGLGNRIIEPEFEGQFKGIDISPRIEYIKNRKPEKPNQIQSITGATISSEAVVKNLNNAIGRVLKNLPKDEMIKDEGVAPKKPGEEHKKAAEPS